jgi:hypothetical protein
VLDVALLVSIVVLALLWFWPEEGNGDPYDDPDNWGSR